MTLETRYRFGFVLTTAAGNMTRYQNLRKYADLDPEVECVWAPVKHYLEPDPFRRLPGPLRSRAVVMREAEPVMSRASRFDAIMFHAFEPYVLSVLREKRGQKPLIVWSQDNPPLSGQANQPLYDGSHARASWRRGLRFEFDRWCVQRTDLFIPFSSWAGAVLAQDCGILESKIRAINVGLDLETWPFLPKAEPGAPDRARPSILFVGGDFVRKGGDLLLDVFCEHFAGAADLHLVTRQPPALIPNGVTVHTDLSGSDPRLRELYAQCDIFVLPTRADMSPWVLLEAMATGRPVIASDIGGIPDMVHPGENGFLIPVSDKSALTQALSVLLTDEALRQRMGTAGRRVVEQDFNAALCVPRILTAMKDAVDQR